MNRAAFFDAVRPHVNLTTQNVIGFEKVLDYGEAVRVPYGSMRGVPLHKLAYILATAWWETAQTMHPVVEAYWLSEAWRRRNLRYYPWHGRGLIQTTWRENYVKMGNEIGVDLTKNPDLLLEWDYALPALFVGMEKGLYTGKRLDDYIDDIDESDSEDLREFANARRIVNGTDKQVTIGKLGLVFERALKAAAYSPVKPTEPPHGEAPGDTPDWGPGGPPENPVQRPAPETGMEDGGEPEKPSASVSDRYGWIVAVLAAGLIGAGIVANVLGLI